MFQILDCTAILIWFKNITFHFSALSDWKFAIKREIENIEAIAATVVKREVSDSRSGKTSEGSGTKVDSSSSAYQKCQVVDSSNISDHGGSSGCRDNNVFVKGKGLSFCMLKS